MVMLLWVGPVAAATEAPPPPADTSAAIKAAQTITAITGMAISPLLGTSAYGAYQYFTTPAEQRARLPWFAQVKYWLPALLLVLVVACKDALGALLPPGWKKPLDILETVENKATGLVAAGAVVPFTVSALSRWILGAAEAAPAGGLMPTGYAAIHVAAIDWSWLLSLLTLPFAVAVYVLVWLTAHAINVLILISPWGAIDAALKGVRTGVLGLLTLSAALDPKIAAVLSLVIVVIAYFTAGWAFRLLTFGGIFCWDFFSLRRRRFTVNLTANRLFSAGRLEGVPMRTYGTLEKKPAGGLRFTYRPWLVLPPRTAEVPAPASLAVGEGLFFSLIQDKRGGVFFLPPRYRGHEATLASAYGLRGVEPAGLRKAWGWIRDTMGFGRVATVTTGG
jgi:hypothetical protein